MAEVIKKLGNMISTAVHTMDLDAEDSAETSTYNVDDSKPLPELPHSNQDQLKEQSVNEYSADQHIQDDQVPETHRENVEQDAEVSRSHIMEDAGPGSHVDMTTIVIERQVQIPSSLVDQVNVVFPSLADDTREVLGDDSPPKEDSSIDDRHGFRVLKANNPERYTDLPVGFTPEMKSRRQTLTEEVREFGGGYYLHPKKIVEIPPELSHQIRTLHDELNQEVVHGADLLHPKEIVEIPAELSQDIRGLRDALNQELMNGSQVLHPKKIAEIPAELSLEIRSLQKELNAEVKSGPDVLHAKEIVEIPAGLGQEVQDLRGALNEEVKQFGDFNHLHPKQIVEIPAELSQEVEKLHEALNKEVIQVGGPEHLHPKQIAEIPAEISPKVRELHSDLTEEVTYVGGQQILHPKKIAEIPAELCDEVRYLHEDLNGELKLIGSKSNILHPKQIAEIPTDLCQEVREAHIYLAEEVKHGADLLHPKEIAEIPAEVDQQTRDLHNDLKVEVALFGGANRLQEDSGMDRSTEPPKELAESVKEMLPSLNTEIKHFNGRDHLNYNRIPNKSSEVPELSIDSFQTHVEQMLLLFGAADSGLVLSADHKAASDNPVLDECVNNVVNALIEAAKKLRGPSTDNDVLVEELHRRRSIIDVDDSAPAREQREEVSKEDENKPLVDEPADYENDRPLDQNSKEVTVLLPTTKNEAVDDKEFLKKSKLMRRLSGWKASHATLNDEGGAEPAYTHVKGMDLAKDTNGKNEASPGRKIRWNPFRKHHRQHVNAGVPVV